MNLRSTDFRGRLRAAVRLIASLMAAAMIGACGGSAARLDRLAPDAVVLAFGDSITYGTGAAAGQNYPALLESLIGRKVQGAGVPGEVSAAGLARLPSALEYYSPQLLILCHGGNDFLRRLGDKQAADNIRAMVRAARSRGVAVMLIAVPKPGFFPAPPDFYADIAEEFGLPIEETVLKKVLTDNELKSDLIHPNGRGYARLAQAIAEVLKKSGAI